MRRRSRLADCQHTVSSLTVRYSHGVQCDGADPWAAIPPAPSSLTSLLSALLRCSASVDARRANFKARENWKNSRLFPRHESRAEGHLRRWPVTRVPDPRPDLSVSCDGEYSTATTWRGAPLRRATTPWPQPELAHTPPLPRTRALCRAPADGQARGQDTALRAQPTPDRSRLRHHPPEGSTRHRRGSGRGKCLGG